MAMRRTTIVAEDELLEQLRAIARDEGLSLGEVIRQGLEWRAKTRRRVPSFISKPPLKAGPPHDTARRADEFIGQYIDERHTRR